MEQFVCDCFLSSSSLALQHMTLLSSDKCLQHLGPRANTHAHSNKQPKNSCIGHWIFEAERPSKALLCWGIA
eukprot:1064980-Pelagomonas_calceolata.AAC.4